MDEYYSIIRDHNPAKKNRILQHRLYSYTSSNRSQASAMSITYSEDSTLSKASAMSITLQSNSLSLPPGWTVRLTGDGKTYYENEINKTTQWEHPSQSLHQAPSLSTKPLPYGWTVQMTSDGKHYYQNEIEKTTQWEPPTIPIPKPQRPSQFIQPPMPSSRNDGARKHEFRYPKLVSDLQSGAFIFLALAILLGAIVWISFGNISLIACAVIIIIGMLLSVIFLYQALSVMYDRTVIFDDESERITMVIDSRISKNHHEILMGSYESFTGCSVKEKTKTVGGGPNGPSTTTCSWIEFQFKNKTFDGESAWDFNTAIMWTFAHRVNEWWSSKHPMNVVALPDKWSIEGKADGIIQRMSPSVFVNQLQPAT